MVAIEFKDAGLRSFLGVQRGISTTFNAIVGVVRDTPKIALTGAQAIGALGGASVQFGTTQENHRPKPNVSQAVDPIFAEAARFCDYLSELDQLISGDLLHMLQEKDADKDIIRCVEKVKSLQASLKGCKSKQLPKVQDTLSKAIEVAITIPIKCGMFSADHRRLVGGQHPLQETNGSTNSRARQRMARFSVRMEDEIESTTIRRLQVRRCGQCTARHGFRTSPQTPQIRLNIAV